MPFLAQYLMLQEWLYLITSFVEPPFIKKKHATIIQYSSQNDGQHFPYDILYTSKHVKILGVVLQDLLYMSNCCNTTPKVLTCFYMLYFWGHSQFQLRPDGFKDAAKAVLNQHKERLKLARSHLQDACEKDDVRTPISLMFSFFGLHSSKQWTCNIYEHLLRFFMQGKLQDYFSTRTVLESWLSWMNHGIPISIHFWIRWATFRLRWGMLRMLFQSSKLWRTLDNWVLREYHPAELTAVLQYMVWLGIQLEVVFGCRNLFYGWGLWWSMFAAKSYICEAKSGEIQKNAFQKKHKVSWWLFSLLRGLVHMWAVARPRTKRWQWLSWSCHLLPLRNIAKGKNIMSHTLHCIGVVNNSYAVACISHSWVLINIPNQSQQLYGWNYI